MARVLVVNSVAPPPFRGGAERSALQIAEDLAAEGHAVTFAGLVPPGSTWQSSTHNAVEIVRVPMANIYWPWDPSRRSGGVRAATWHAFELGNPIAAFRTRRLLKSVRPDVVITNNLRGWTLAVWRLARKRGIPVAHVVRDYSLICARGTRYRDGTTCEGLCGGCQIRMRVSRVQSTGVRAWGVSRAAMDIHRAYGLFEGQLSRAIYPRIGERARVDGPPHSFDIGYIGRVQPSKGTDVLAQAAGITGLHIAIAGAATSRAQETLLRSGAHLTFVGTADPFEFISRLGVLVVPSSWEEPLGRVVLEATAVGTPVIISDVPGLIEAAEAAGSRYATFRRGDAEDLSNLLLRYSRGEIDWLQGKGANSYPSANDIVIDALANAPTLRRSRRGSESP